MYVRFGFEEVSCRSLWFGRRTTSRCGPSFSNWRRTSDINSVSTKSVRMESPFTYGITHFFQSNGKQHWICLHNPQCWSQKRLLPSLKKDTTGRTQFAQSRFRQSTWCHRTAPTSRFVYEHRKDWESRKARPVYWNHSPAVRQEQHPQRHSFSKSPDAEWKAWDYYADRGALLRRSVWLIQAEIVDFSVRIIWIKQIGYRLHWTVRQMMRKWKCWLIWVLKWQKIKRNDSITHNHIIMYFFIV